MEADRTSDNSFWVIPERSTGQSLDSPFASIVLVIQTRVHLQAKYGPHFQARKGTSAHSKQNSGVESSPRYAVNVCVHQKILERHFSNPKLQTQEGEERVQKVSG